MSNAKECQTNGAACVAEESDRIVVRPYVAIREDDSQYLLRAEVPGVGQDGVSVTVENDVLTLEARTAKVEESAVGPDSFRLYRHIVKLGDRVEPDDVKGKIENGVLVLTLPKRRQYAARKVDILAA